MQILAIDPGSELSAYVLLHGSNPIGWGKIPNEELLRRLRDPKFCNAATNVIEQIASYGMPVGEEVFKTCRWSGRFEEAISYAGGQTVYLPRREVKLELCASPRANDATIRQAVLDRFGGHAAAVGRKATPGPLYGMKADVWQALALGLTYWEKARRAGRG